MQPLLLCFLWTFEYAYKKYLTKAKHVHVYDACA